MYLAFHKYNLLYLVGSQETSRNNVLQVQVNGLVQDYSIFSALTMNILQSSTKPSR